MLPVTARTMRAVLRPFLRAKDSAYPVKDLKGWAKRLCRQLGMSPQQLAQIVAAAQAERAQLLEPVFKKRAAAGKMPKPVRPSRWLRDLLDRTAPTTTPGATTVASAKTADPTTATAGAAKPVRASKTPPTSAPAKPEQTRKPEAAVA